MIAMDNVRVNFNGVDLYDTFGLMNCSVGGEQQTHIFAGSKTLSTVSPMYRSSQINAGISGEPLSFTLTFALKETEEWNDDLVDAVYRTLDVDTYKPLRFGDEDIYYNCIPFVGNISEMKLFAHNGGYFTVSFQCDAPHCWRNAEYNFDRITHHDKVTPWNMTNLSNIKGYDGDCRCWPYIVIDHFGEDENGNKIAGNNDGYFVSFGISDFIVASANERTTADAIGDKGWFSMYWLPLRTTRVEIDTYNQQVHGYVEEDVTYTQDGETITITEEHEKNFLPYMCDTSRDSAFNPYFIYLIEGGNLVWHRSMQGANSNGQSNYKVHFYLTMPYMK